MYTGTRELTLENVRHFRHERLLFFEATAITWNVFCIEYVIHVLFFEAVFCIECVIYVLFFEAVFCIECVLYVLFFEATAIT